MAGIERMPYRLRKLDKDVEITLQVAVTKEFRFRVWLATKLITLASWILGGRVRIIEESE